MNLASLNPGHRPPPRRRAKRGRKPPVSDPRRAGEAAGDLYGTKPLFRDEGKDDGH